MGRERDRGGRVFEGKGVVGGVVVENEVEEALGATGVEFVNEVEGSHGWRGLGVSKVVRVVVVRLERG